MVRTPALVTVMFTRLPYGQGQLKPLSVDVIIARIPAPFVDLRSLLQERPHYYNITIIKGKVNPNKNPPENRWEMRRDRDDPSALLERIVDPVRALPKRAYSCSPSGLLSVPVPRVGSCRGFGNDRV